MGAEFPIFPADGCRSVIYNSVPVYMADKQDVTEKIGACRHHFIFSSETKKETDAVIEAHEKEFPASYPIRRIK